MKNLPQQLRESSARVHYARATAETARQAIKCLDYTNLGHMFNAAQVTRLCHHLTDDKSAHAASVIVMPNFVHHAYNSAARGHIRVGTIINRMGGIGTPDSTARDTRGAMARGADEIEIVLPYNALRNGEKQKVRDLLQACKQQCSDAAAMRVVMESDAFRDFVELYEAASLAIECGADMLSTASAPTRHGKPTTSIEAAATLLQVIKDHGTHTGLKIGGAPDRLDAVAPYIALTGNIMEKKWIRPDNFRIGGQVIYDEARRLILTEPKIS